MQPPSAAVCIDVLVVALPDLSASKHDGLSQVPGTLCPNHFLSRFSDNITVGGILPVGTPALKSGSIRESSLTWHSSPGLLVLRIPQLRLPLEGGCCFHSFMHACSCTAEPQEARETAPGTPWSSRAGCSAAATATGRQPRSRLFHRSAVWTTSRACTSMVHSVMSFLRLVGRQVGVDDLDQVHQLRHLALVHLLRTRAQPIQETLSHACLATG